MKLRLTIIILLYSLAVLHSPSTPLCGFSVTLYFYRRKLVAHRKDNEERSRLPNAAQCENTHVQHTCRYTTAARSSY